MKLMKGRMRMGEKNIKRRKDLMNIKKKQMINKMVGGK